LDRFVQAQERDHAQALAEIRSGRKRTHWMWYILPHISGLGSSAMAERYAIRGLAEADAYLRHPVLGPRLHECAEAIAGLAGRSAHDILGSPDDRNLQSSATLFTRVSPAGWVFHRLLERYFQEEPDRRTLGLLGDAREGA
jgi:uncharacterized protein (DUF1810 family)